MSNHEFTLSDQEARLYQMPHWFMAVDGSAVNLDDLLSMQPGSIVRCLRRPTECITIFSAGDSESLGCVAGWISEGDA